jgi:hypothetical protein
MSYTECGTQSDGDELKDDHDLFRAIQVSASDQSVLYLTNESIAWRQYRRPYLCTIWWLESMVLWLGLTRPLICPPVSFAPTYFSLQMLYLYVCYPLVGGV